MNLTMSAVGERAGIRNGVTLLSTKEEDELQVDMDNIEEWKGEVGG